MVSNIMIGIEIFIILIGRYIRFTSKANVRLFNVFQLNKVDYDILIILTGYVVHLFVFTGQVLYGRVILANFTILSPRLRT